MSLLFSSKNNIFLQKKIHVRTLLFFHLNVVYKYFLIKNEDVFYFLNNLIEYKSIFLKSFWENLWDCYLNVLSNILKSSILFSKTILIIKHNFFEYSYI